MLGRKNALTRIPDGLSDCLIVSRYIYIKFKKNYLLILQSR